MKFFKSIFARTPYLDELYDRTGIVVPNIYMKAKDETELRAKIDFILSFVSYNYKGEKLSKKSRIRETYKFNVVDGSKIIIGWDVDLVDFNSSPQQNFTWLTPSNHPSGATITFSKVD